MFLTVSDPSSVALHILIYCNIRYTFLWMILEILCFVFKYYHLPYPSHAFGIELSIVIVLALNDSVRHFFGYKGNLVLQTQLLVLYIFYSIICAAGFTFLLCLQCYVQRVEILLSGISLLLIIIEIFVSVIILIRNSRAMPVLTREEKIRRYQQAHHRFQASITNE